MKVDIYETKRSNTYLAVPMGSLIPHGWTTRYFKTVDLNKDNPPPIGLDPTQVIADIEDRGWSAIEAKVVVEVKVAG